MNRSEALPTTVLSFCIRTNQEVLGTMYVSASEARAILKDRRTLRPAIEKWWTEQQWHIPSPFKGDQDIAGFGRAVATRRYEDALFLHYAKEAGFTPLWLQYLESTLCTHSPFKRSLVKPMFYERIGRKGGIATTTHELAPIATVRAQPISSIRTMDGVPLVDYHHELHSLFGLGKSAILDCSAFYGQFGPASEYYVAYLSLFLAHGVLFEDYHGGESGDALTDFTNQIFTPAFEELESLFGVSPLLVKMPWHPNLRLYMPKGCTQWIKHGVIPEDLLLPN